MPASKIHPLEGMTPALLDVVVSVGSNAPTLYAKERKEWIV